MCIFAGSSTHLLLKYIMNSLMKTYNYTTVSIYNLSQESKTNRRDTWACLK